MKKLVIIDGNAIIHRSYHALPKTLRTATGELTNAVHGFVGILMGILEVEQPDYLATAWDMKGPTFRDAILVEGTGKVYKGTRKKTDDELIQQFPRVYQVLEALNVPAYKKPGLEADDYLGIVAHLVREGGESGGEEHDAHKDIEIVIVTSDQDALQLVCEGVTVVAPISGYTKVKRYDRDAVMEKLGVWPEQVTDYKGLRGDSSDNIPGVPGIGPKGAVKLIDQFGTVEGIYERIEEVENARIRGLLKEHEESARLSKHVATILRADPDMKFDLEKCKIHDFDIEAVRRIFGELSFKSHLRRVEGLNKAWANQRAAEQQWALF
jgi:DNA polymerase-1